MRRSIRTLVTLAAATAATAVAVAAPAAATTTDPQPLVADSSVQHWGSYFSSNFKAKAQGTTRVHWNPSETSNNVRVQGKLYDQDFRTLAQGGKCAFVQFRVHHIYQPNWKWQNAQAYKLCDAGTVKHFTFWTHNVDKVHIRVSQIGKYSDNVVRKGAWHQVNI
jgi:phosphate-selective porin